MFVTRSWWGSKGNLKAWVNRKIRRLSEVTDGDAVEKQINNFVFCNVFKSLSHLPKRNVLMLL